MNKKIIFSSESIKHIPKNLLEDYEIHPPISRGDLDLFDINPIKPPVVIIFDGLYGSTMSITPTECRKFIEKGGTLIGASSMGALRASELWSVGMIGMGTIYLLFRLGKLRSDADVAVSYDYKFDEATVSIVHIRKILSILEENGTITQFFAHKMLYVANSIIWFERFWDFLIEKWTTRFSLDDNIVSEISRIYLDPKSHPKKIDAFNAIKIINAKRWDN